MRLANYRGNDGKFFACIDGGYPVVYQDMDECTICADCANKSEVGTNEEAVNAFVHYEGESIFCDGCSKEIESAYGDPFADDDSED